MGILKYDPPTDTFPYKISRRLNMLSVPKKYYIYTAESMPAVNSHGVRVSALRGQASDRLIDAAKPMLRRLLALRRTYRNRFSLQRLELVDRMIELSNASFYSKLANSTISIRKKGDSKDVKRKRGWTESEWKKRMEHINAISAPKKDFRPPPPSRGIRKPLTELMYRINHLAEVPDYKRYRRLSKEQWYRDPLKVSPSAMKYVISDRIKKLAQPKPIPQP